MAWYRAGNANGVNAYVNDEGQLLSVTGTSPNFTISLGREECRD